MNYIKHLSGFFDKVSKDDRLNPTHISMYVSLFQFWNACRFHNPISISRNEVMKVSKICSTATYHKCIRELNNFGYLKYMPSYNPFKGSLVYLFDFQTSSKPAQNKKHIKNETGVEQAVAPYINTTNNNKLQTKVNFVEQKKSTSLNFNKDKKGADNPEGKNKRKKVAPKKKSDLSSPVILSATKGRSPRAESRGEGKGKGMVIPELTEVKEYFVSQKFSEIEAEKFFNHFQSNGWMVGGRSQMKDWKAASRNWILNWKKFNSNKTNSDVTTGKNYSEAL